MIEKAFHRTSACIVPVDQVCKTVYRYWARGYKVQYVNNIGDGRASIGATKKVAEKRFNGN